MKTACTAALALMLLTTAVATAQEPKFPTPTKEHEWLKQLEGEWVTEGEAMFGPDQPAIKCKGTDTTRSIGGFWVVSEVNSKMMDVPTKGIMTIGYNPEKKKYVGTWIDSMTNLMWQYEGTVDETGKVLTLEAEGPNPLMPDKRAKFRDAIEIKSKDHKILTSSMQLDDGKWVTFMTIHMRRQKAE